MEDSKKKSLAAPVIILILEKMIFANEKEETDFNGDNKDDNDEDLTEGKERCW